MKRNDIGRGEEGTMMPSLPTFFRQRIPPAIENRLRLTVREETEHVVYRFFHHPSPPTTRSCSPLAARFQLRFVGRVPSPIFTQSRILADHHHGSPIRIELWDASSNCVVLDGPLSSLKLQIVPLHGDFGDQDWPQGEFPLNIVRERDGRRPLIVGDTNITLRQGEAYMTNIILTDNSRWTRSRHFRLGAQAHPDIPLQEPIKEAISSSFIVKDRRGERNRKHYPPSLHDEVWRLENISKGGRFSLRLAAEGIGTVKEFLCWHETNPASLRQILGSNIPDRTWNKIVRHAASCAVNVHEQGEYFQYADSGTCLWFDCTCKLIAASFDGGQTLNPPHDLPVPQALLLQDLKREAHKRRNEWTRVSSASNALPVDAVALASSPLNAPAGPSTGVHHPRFLMSSSSSYHEVEAHLPVVCPPALPLATMFSAGEEMGCWQQELETPLLFQPSASIWGNAWNLGSKAEAAEAQLLSHLYNLDVHIPAYKKRRVGWCKIRAAIAFGSLRRSAVARRR
ncbi:hypothetical protein MLD38_010540 [Melastoma candidum]|uniref:Uncharacterized protein n=1 Tax=Melastoma candidum TaxID=119954 RepID=A0ACB9R197_9MYRT|nr:hypothetical protein MLD38_010540 [Melastoma candidum]